MNIKKILLTLVILLCLSGCTNIKDYSYDDIVNTLSDKAKSANTHKKGYEYYVPAGLQLVDSGTNYSVLTSSDITYYLYVDLVSYFNELKYDYQINDKILYSKKINYNDKFGYVEIKLWENNQYLIEIMYNYAKIEVMVEENLINKALLNSISILNSIKYDNTTIERLLNDDELSYNEEVYELFDEDKSNSNILDYIEDDSEDNEDDEIKDTDFIN